MEATFKDNLKRVVISSNEGKIEKSNGLSVYMAINKMVMASVIFMANIKSRSKGGSGMIMTTRIPITPATVRISLVTIEFEFVFKMPSIF